VQQAQTETNLIHSTESELNGLCFSMFGQSDAITNILLTMQRKWYKRCDCKSANNLGERRLHHGQDSYICHVFDDTFVQAYDGSRKAWC